MGFKKGLKVFQRAAARWGLLSSTWLIARLPYPMVMLFMRVLTWIGFLFTVKLKRIARESLQTAFGQEKTPQEVRRIMRQCFYNLGQGMVELIYFVEHPDQVKEKFTIEGEDYLKQALALGKGVVAVTAHYGNFPLMQLAFAQFGYDVNVIVRQTRDKKIAAHLKEKMHSVQVKSIYSLPSRRCVMESLRALKDNGMLFVLLDQNFGSGTGVFVDFFGRKAATGVGPVVFAERSGAPIVPIFNIREGKDRHRIIIEPAIALEQREDRDEMLQVNVQKITRLIEKYVREYPHEWGWMHRRWKTQKEEGKSHE